jgi:hypothetical protein
MGGVVLSEMAGSSQQNVAYRAVPRGSGGVLGYNSIPLPLGLIQVLANPPETDTNDPNFNVFELVNLIGRTPYTIQLVEPRPLSSDVVVDVGQNEFRVDLGELQRLFPDREIRYGLVATPLAFEAGTKNFFAGIRPQAAARNSLDLDDNLQAALAEAVAFQPNTAYGIGEQVRGQAAIAFTGGAALPVLPAVGAPDGDPRKGGTALYAGARLKYLRGIALWQAEGAGTFTTGDTIFGPTTPLRFDYQADVRRTSDPGLDTGDGFGADAGVVFFVNRLELGLGVNDIATVIHWKNTDVDRYTYDSATNSNIQTRIASGEDYNLKFPVTGYFNMAYRLAGGATLAGTLERTANERVIPRAGAEVWLGLWPVRGGLYLDQYSLLQYTAGSGVKLGPVGLDVALATHSRGITESRGLELAASIALY